MTKILILLIPILLLSDENYQKALDYLSGKIGAKTEVITITDPKKCGNYFECAEEFSEGKKEVIIKHTKIDFKSAIKHLQKSYDKNKDIRSAKKLVTLFILHPELKKDKELLKIMTETKNKIDNLEYIKYFNKASTFQNNKLKRYLSYKRVLSTSPASTIEYKIAKKRVQKIEDSFNGSFWQWLWFKIKSFFVNMFFKV